MELTCLFFYFIVGMLLHTFVPLGLLVFTLLILPRAVRNLLGEHWIRILHDKGLVFLLCMCLCRGDTCLHHCQRTWFLVNCRLEFRRGLSKLFGRFLQGFKVQSLLAVEDEVAKSFTHVWKLFSGQGAFLPSQLLLRTGILCRRSQLHAACGIGHNAWARFLSCQLDLDLDLFFIRRRNVVLALYGVAFLHNWCNRYRILLLVLSELLGFMRNSLNWLPLLWPDLLAGRIVISP